MVLYFFDLTLLTNPKNANVTYNWYSTVDLRCSDLHYDYQIYIFFYAIRKKTRVLGSVQ